MKKVEELQKGKKSYEEMAEEIISIMEHDYVGFETKEGWGNKEELLANINRLSSAGKLNRESFIETISYYLLDYKDSHVQLLDYNDKKASKVLGFSARRIDNALFVFDITQDQVLKIGDCIVRLDSDTIEEAAHKYKKLLGGQPNERQMWGKIIKKYSSITFLRDNKERTYKMEMYNHIPHTSKYTCEELNSNTVLLTFNDFNDIKQMQTLLEEYQNEINKKYWIIDVRDNAGGNDAVFHPLLPYIFPENSKMEFDSKQYHNMTERNYNLRIGMLEAYMEMDPNNEAFIEHINNYKKKKGQGFVLLSDDNEDIEINGKKNPEKIIILSDRYCGSSGDAFCHHSRKSPKVTLIGRATYGVIDYGNIVFEDFGDGLKLMYSTSINKWKNNEEGYDNVGVQPDIYIPWSKEHMERDVDLEEALKLIME